MAMAPPLKYKIFSNFFSFPDGILKWMFRASRKTGFHSSLHFYWQFSRYFERKGNTVCWYFRVEAASQAATTHPIDYFCVLHSVWPDRAIYWTLSNFSMLLATSSLPKSPTFLGNFCKGVKIFHFSSDKSFFGNFYRHLATYYWSHCLH